MGWRLFSLIDFMLHKVCRPPTHTPPLPHTLAPSLPQPPPPGPRPTHTLSPACFPLSFRGNLSRCLCLMHFSPQAPFCGIKRYHDRVDAETRQAFLAYSERQHKDNMDEFEQLWELAVTRQQPATGVRSARRSGGKDIFERMRGPSDAVAAAAAAAAAPPAAARPAAARPAAAAASPAKARPAVPVRGGEAAAAAAAESREAAPPASPARASASPARAAHSPGKQGAAAAASPGKSPGKAR